MFQNINENTIEFDSSNDTNKNKVNIFSNVFAKNNIILYQ